MCSHSVTVVSDSAAASADVASASAAVACAAAKTIFPRFLLFDLLFYAFWDACMCMLSVYVRPCMREYVRAYMCVRVCVSDQ